MNARIRYARVHRRDGAALSRSTLKRVLIGSTAERVLDDLTCDVLIVKPLCAPTPVGPADGAATFARGFEPPSEHR